MNESFMHRHRGALFVSILILILFTGNVVYGETEHQFDLSRVIDALGSATEEFDRLDEVKEKAWVGTDRSKVLRNINDLLDTAIAYLDIPELVKLRQDYRKFERAIENDTNHIARLRERRLFSPEGEPTLRRFVPTQIGKELTAKTRGDYDLLIEAYHSAIEGHQYNMKKIENSLAELLADIGIFLDPDQIEFWLSSVIGDDIFSMSVVFVNIKAVTNQLAELTRESGESLSYAKRYYGMLVMLHELVTKMQKDFISKIDNEVLPKLNQFSKEADKNIREAQQLLRQGGNNTSITSNIASNQLTKEVIDLYRQVVTQHRNQVAKGLQVSDHERLVAINTYKTVRLSSDLRDLIREGSNTFETLSNLQIPAAEEFQNKEIREEFRKLTDRLKQP